MNEKIYTNKKNGMAVLIGVILAYIYMRIFLPHCRLGFGRRGRAPYTACDPYLLFRMDTAFGP